jgi:hypothetical protein
LRLINQKALRFFPGFVALGLLFWSFWLKPLVTLWCATAFFIFGAPIFLPLADFFVADPLRYPVIGPIYAILDGCFPWVLPFYAFFFQFLLGIGWSSLLVSAEAVPPAELLTAKTSGVDWAFFARERVNQLHLTIEQLRFQHGRLLSHWEKLSTQFDGHFGLGTEYADAPFSSDVRAIFSSGLSVVGYCFSLDFFPAMMPPHDGLDRQLYWDEFHRGLPPQVRWQGYGLSQWRGLIYNAAKFVESLCTLNYHLLVRHGPADLTDEMPSLSPSGHWRLTIAHISKLIALMGERLDHAQECHRRVDQLLLVASTRADYKVILCDAPIVEAQLLTAWKETLGSLEKHSTDLQQSMAFWARVRFTAGLLAFSEFTSLGITTFYLVTLDADQNNYFPIKTFGLAMVETAWGECLECIKNFYYARLLWIYSDTVGDVALVSASQLRDAEPSLTSRINDACFQSVYHGFPTQDLLSRVLQEQCAFALHHIRQGSLLWTLYEPKYQDLELYRQSLAPSPGPKGG